MTPLQLIKEIITASPLRVVINGEGFSYHGAIVYVCGRFNAEQIRYSVIEFVGVKFIVRDQEKDA